MNKKTLIICLAVMLIFTVICCSACSGNTAEKLREINTLLSREYSDIKLSVTTASDQAELKAEYEFVKSDTNTNIKYSIERLSGFGTNGSSVTVPSQFKTLVEGSAVYDGENIVSMDGNEVDPQILVGAMDTSMMFRISYFSHMSFKKSVFSAKVVDPKGFMDNDGFDGKNMTVKVIYGASSLASIEINYTAADDSSVKMLYDFIR